MPSSIDYILYHVKYHMNILIWEPNWKTKLERIGEIVLNLLGILA